MKKIIGLGVALLIFLLANMFTFYHGITHGVMVEEGQRGSLTIEREVEIWGIRYNPVWYQAFMP